MAKDVGSMDLFPRILDPREIRAKHSAEAVNRAWAKRKLEGRTKRHPNQKANYRGRDGYRAPLTW